MSEASEHEREISENIEAERCALAKIRRLTGIELPRLQWIGTVRGPELEKLQPAAAELLQTEKNVVTRGILYGVFGVRSKEEYFENLVNWYYHETEDQGLQVLERCLIAQSNKPNRHRLNDCLLLTPGKLKFDGLRFLLRQSKTDERLLARIGEGYENCWYDLEVLSVIARQHEADYARIVGGGTPSDRLTARQCSALLRYQLPGNEYGFRRARLVPFYARILQSTIAPATELRGFCVEHGFLIDEPTGNDSAVRALQTHECVPLAIEVQEDAGLTRAVVLSPLALDEPADARATGQNAATCRPRRGVVQRYGVSLVEAPIPPEWNLFPKRLLPPDHPLRSVRPD
jgi:hypothetical protein